MSVAVGSKGAGLPPGLPPGVHFARARHLVIMLMVRALSFVGAGRDASHVLQSMVSAVDEYRASIGAGHAMVSRGGTSYIRWHVESGRGWVLDEVAAFPRGHGRGTALLETFLARADAAHASVTLCCPPGRIEWYRRHGFVLQAPGVDPVARAYLAAGLIRMRRPVGADARRRRRGPAMATTKCGTSVSPHPVVPVSEQRVKSSMPAVRARVGTAAFVAAVVLAGTAGCGPATSAPTYRAYVAASDLRH
jgi:GNAT superfamily N-acetyltransferase